MNNEITKIQIESGTYTLKDSYARSKYNKAYNTLNALKNDSKIEDDMLVVTKGYYSINDGGGAFYVVRQITNQDVVDNMFLIALNDTSLVAELIYNDINVKQIGAKGDGITDDTNVINIALSKGKNVIFPSGEYLVNESIDITTNNIIVYGNNSTLKPTHSGDCVNVNGNNIEIYNLNINGACNYGYDLNGNYCTIKNCNINNTLHNAIMITSSHNTIDNVVANLCGWDCVGNYGNASYNIINNCKAIKTKRHGFSTDPTTHHISFINCYCEDVGSPELAEGHSCYHFEHSDYGIVNNCKAKYTNNHTNNTTKCNNAFIGIRCYQSNNVLIDNINIIYDENYNPLDVSRPIVVENSQNFQIINSNIINNSADSNVGQIYINSPIELNNNILLNINVDQSDAYQGYIKKMINNNITLNNKNYFAYFYYLCENSIIANNNFKGNSNLDYFFKGRFVNTSFENNIFDTGIHSIILTHDASNSNLKSIANRILNNTFKDLTNMISFYSIDNDTTFIEKNLFTGTCDYVFEGNYNSAQIKENYKNNLTVNQNFKLNLYVDIFDDLKSTFDYRSYALNSSNNKFYISVDENGNLKSNQL